MEALAPNPAYLIGPRTDVLVWNAAAMRMLGEPTRAPDGVQNLLWWMFTDPAGTGRVGRHRAQHARALPRRARPPLRRPRLRSLIEALLAESPAFGELWPRHEVLDPQLGTKVIDHPELGRLALHHLQSIPTSHPALRLTQFVPADAATRAALR